MGFFTYRCPECESKDIVEHKDMYTPVVKCAYCKAIMVRAIPNNKWNQAREKYKEFIND